MSDTDDLPEGVHLVGSIALDSVEEVFRTAGTLLGRRLKRVPDGEPGGRRLWISWQYPLLRANGYLKVDAQQNPQRGGMFPTLCLGDGVAPAQIRFGELGYAREARASYQDFVAARQRGELPPAARFQISLPTPMAVIVPFCAVRDHDAIEPAYEAAMVGEVAAICRAIPHADLAIQWDVCIEMVIWDGQIADRYPSHGTSKPEMVARFKRLAAAVPADVETRLPSLLRRSRRQAFRRADRRGQDGGAGERARIVRRASHRVPAHAGADRPQRRRLLQAVRGAQAPAGHRALSRPGARRRRDGRHRPARRRARRHVVGGFGIATECGMARARTPDLVARLLALHAAGSREPAA